MLLTSSPSARLPLTLSHTLDEMTDPAAQKDRGMQALAVVEKLKRALSNQVANLNQREV